MKLAIKEYLPIVFIFCLTLFFSTYKLTESPRTWMDEGIITQVSRNIAEHNKHALQVAPNTFVSAGIVSTGYPVTYPISIFFDLFGIGILQARIVMVLFILLLIISVYLYLKNNHGSSVAFWGTALVATFSPLYGHGKNVLGEVPGLAFFFPLLLLIDKVDKGDRRFSVYILIGILTGLVFSTKSIFILVIPAWIALILWRKYHQEVIHSKHLLISSLVFFVMALLWFVIQFNNDSWAHILSIYANPHSIGLFESVKNNLALFIKELQPIYFGFTFVIWLISVLLRINKNQSIASSELFAFIFSSLIFLAFFRTTGYYRYFFLAQFVGLVYFLPAIKHLISPTHYGKYIRFLVYALIVFHTYQTLFNSWVASYYQSNRSAEISFNLRELSQSEKILFYQTPELIIFLPNNNYYQYIDIAVLMKVGEINKGLIAEGFFDKIYLNKDLYFKEALLFQKYKPIYEFENYAILDRTT